MYVCIYIYIYIIWMASCITHACTCVGVFARMLGCEQFATASVKTRAHPFDPKLFVKHLSSDEPMDRLLVAFLSWRGTFVL